MVEEEKKLNIDCVLLVKMYKSSNIGRMIDGGKLVEILLEAGKQFGLNSHCRRGIGRTRIVFERNNSYVGEVRVFTDREVGGFSLETDSKEIYEKYPMDVLKYIDSMKD